MGILVEAGRMFSNAMLHFIFSSASFRGVSIFNFAAAISTVVKKRETAFAGAGARKHYMRAKSLFLDGFRTADPGVGDREDFCRYRILLLFEIIYGYRPNSREWNLSAYFN